MTHTVEGRMRTMKLETPDNPKEGDVYKVVRGVLLKVGGTVVNTGVPIGLQVGQDIYPMPEPLIAMGAIRGVE